MTPMGPEHPIAGDTLVPVSYIEFEDLCEPDLELSVADLVAFAAGDDWKQQYDCLNLFRSINKHRREYILLETDGQSVLSNIMAPFVKEQIENLRSNVSKCALMLVKEVFQLGFSQEVIGDSRLKTFVRLALPGTLHKTVYEKNFIATEAKKACEYCS